MEHILEKQIQARFNLDEAEATELLTLYVNRNTPRTYEVPSSSVHQPLSKDGWFHRFLATSPSSLATFVSKKFLKQKPGSNDWFQFDPVVESKLCDLFSKMP